MGGDVDASTEEELTLALSRAGADWRVVVERAGERRELGGLDELIRYLEELAGTRVRQPRGLR